MPALLSLLLNGLTAGHTETQVVAADRRVVAAAVRRPTVAWDAPPAAAAIHAVRALFVRQLENLAQSNQVTYEFVRLPVLLCCLLRDQPAECRSDVARPCGGPENCRVFNDRRVNVAEIAT